MKIKNTLTLVTIQSEKVYNILECNRIYKLSSEFSRNWDCPIIFKQLKNCLNSNPIFALYKFENKYIKNINDIDYNRLEYFGAHVTYNNVALLLEVPKSNVLLTNFYNWSDLMYYEKEHENYPSGLEFNSIFSFTINDAIQAILKEIKIEWLKDIKRF